MGPDLKWHDHVSNPIPSSEKTKTFLVLYMYSQYGNYIKTYTSKYGEWRDLEDKLLTIFEYPRILYWALLNE